MPHPKSVRAGQCRPRFCLLTQRNKSRRDAGLYAALVYDTEEHDFVLESGPLLQKRFGREQLNLNFVFERPLANNANTEFLYRAQWKHNAPGSIDYGLQAFGDFGALAQEDEHRIGPALFGSFRDGRHARWKWNGAVLAGMNRAAPNISLRCEIEYETH